MTVFRAATLRTFFFAFHAGAKELKKMKNKENSDSVETFEGNEICHVVRKHSLRLDSA